ncbi:MAG: DMT family transporter [Candidatus Roizmanbacteria bacterium]|nr:DMT family transporter [Candidatus Roizmanbacteria bacterium]
MKFSKGFQFTFLAALFWAISIVMARVILRAGENAYNVAFWTTLLASPYWLFVLSKKIPELKTTTKKNYLILLGMGLVSTIGVTITEVFALKYSPAVNYSFLIRSVILFTIIFAYLFLGEKITLKKVIIAILILTGAYFLTTKGQLISFSLGDIFTLTEAALIAFGNNVLGKMATNGMSTDLSASGSFLIGVIPIVLIALFNNAIVFPKSPLLLVSLTIMYILITLLRFRAYKNATASYVTMVFSFTPVFVSLMAIPFLKETMTPIQIVGGILIVIASISVEKLKI